MVGGTQGPSAGLQCLMNYIHSSLSVQLLTKLNYLDLSLSLKIFGAFWNFVTLVNFSLNTLVLMKSEVGQYPTSYVGLEYVTKVERGEIFCQILHLLLALISPQSLKVPLSKP